MLNALAYSSFALGEYRAALVGSRQRMAIADEFGLSFVIPFAEINRACSLTALREFAGTRRALGSSRSMSEPTPTRSLRRSMRSNPLLLKSRGAISPAPSTILLHARIHVRPGASKATSMPVVPLCCRLSTDCDEADDQTYCALGQSGGLETQRSSPPRGSPRRARATRLRAFDAYEEIVECGLTYVLPLAWRARFEVAAVLLKTRHHRDSVLALMFNANDTAIAKRSGISVPRAASRRLCLSAREQEVCELLAEGRTNQEIATMLFISLSTTKVHVKHILEKLGVRSRVEAARLWEDGR